MKLKQRVVLLGAIVCLSFVAMTCMIYYYAHSYHSGVKLAITDTVTRMKWRLAEHDRIRPRRRRLKKSMVTPNSSLYDSNRALELELNETEYEDLLNRRDTIVRILDASQRNPEDVLHAKSSTRGLSKECSYEAMRQEGPAPRREQFPDLLQFLGDRNPLESNLGDERITLQEIHGIENTGNFSQLDMFHIGISDMDLYAEDDPNVEGLLLSMATQAIVHVEEKEGGTQLKLIITYQDGSQALFKPMS